MPKPIRLGSGLFGYFALIGLFVFALTTLLGMKGILSIWTQRIIWWFTFWTMLMMYESRIVNKNMDISLAELDKHIDKVKKEIKKRQKK